MLQLKCTILMLVGVGIPGDCVTNLEVAGMRVWWPVSDAKVDFWCGHGRPLNFDDLFVSPQVLSGCKRRARMKLLEVK